MPDPAARQASHQGLPKSFHRHPRPALRLGRLDRPARTAYPSRMKPNMLVWLAVFVGLALALRASGLRGPGAVTVVAGALVLAVPLSVTRFRQERNLVRTIWRALTKR